MRSVQDPEVLAGPYMVCCRRMQQEGKDRVLFLGGEADTYLVFRGDEGLQQTHAVASMLTLAILAPTSVSGAAEVVPTRELAAPSEPAGSRLEAVLGQSAGVERSRAGGSRGRGRP